MSGDGDLASLIADLRATIHLVESGTRGRDESPIWLTAGDLARLLDAAEANRA